MVLPLLALLMKKDIFFMVAIPQLKQFFGKKINHKDIFKYNLEFNAIKLMNKY
jgi:hypothetical protein